MSQPLDSVHPVAPEVSLVTSAHPMEGLNSDGWAFGVTARDTLGTPSGRFPRCADEEDVKDDVPDGGDAPEFEPLWVYAVDGCEGRADVDRMRRSARAALDAKLAWEVARELWTGETTGNPSLQSTAIEITVDPAPAPVVVAARALLANFEDCTKGSQAFLHVPSIVVDQLIDADFARRSGNRLVTPLGHVVVPGPGYPNMPGDWGPLASDGAAEAAEGEVWLYVTGPVQFAQGDMVETSSGDAPGVGTFARLNKTIVLPERLVLYRFPTDCVFAAKASVGV